MVKRQGISKKNGASLEIPSSDDDAARAVLFEMWMGCQQLFRERWGDNETVLITMATGIGRISKSPVDISTISAMTGLSRPTVRRRLQQLASEGRMTLQRIGNRTVVMPKAGAVEDTRQLAEKFESLVRKAGKKLEEIRLERNLEEG